jgi:lysophospholipase L1-like esterase
MSRRIVSFLLLLAPFPVTAAEFEFKNGDRVVLIGSTLIEREQRYGYWEATLTARHPDKNITFRNLGWSGDTVWGEARAGFDTAVEGYKRLIEHVKAEKPTVIVVGYGTNESFAGEAGLPKFKDQLKKLLDDLATTKARFVLLAPPLVDSYRWTFGSADDRNKNIKLYTDVIEKAAHDRGAWFAAEFCTRYGPASAWTDNGMHLTAYGFWSTAHNLLNELKLAAGYALKPVELSGQTSLRFRQSFLPQPPAPPGGDPDSFQSDSVVKVKDLRPGRYSLTVDGQPVHTADAAEWLKPEKFEAVLTRRGPSLDQAEKLRQTIITKNELYFHRWRPQNVTYLFGFRKHEQGNNAVEIPQFDPLIEAKEKEIAKLRKPVEHVYELVPAK